LPKGIAFQLKWCKTTGAQSWTSGYTVGIIYGATQKTSSENIMTKHERLLMDGSICAGRQRNKSWPMQYCPGQRRPGIWQFLAIYSGKLSAKFLFPGLCSRSGESLPSHLWSRLATQRLWPLSLSLLNPLFMILFFGVLKLCVEFYLNCAKTFLLKQTAKVILCAFHYCDFISIDLAPMRAHNLWSFFWGIKVIRRILLELHQDISIETDLEGNFVWFSLLRLY